MLACQDVKHSAVKKDLSLRQRRYLAIYLRDLSGKFLVQCSKTIRVSLLQLRIHMRSEKYALLIVL